MTIPQVYDYYWRNWANAMRQLGFARNTHHYWRKIKYIPIPTQLKIEEITKGDLKADVDKSNEISC